MTDNAQQPGPFDAYVPPGASGPSPEQERALLDEMAARGITPEPKDDATQAALMSFEHFPAAEHLGVYAGTPHGVGDDPAALSFDTTARGWLHAAELPRETGSALLAAMHRYEHASAGRSLTDSDRELAKRSTEANLERVLGPDYVPMVELAKKLAQRIEKSRPGFMDWLVRTGAGNDPQLITAMGFQAEMLRRRGPL